jgi:hypothetical protein
LFGSAFVSGNLNVEEVVSELILNIVYCDRILIMICTCLLYIKGAEKMKFDKAEISGLLVLFIGVGLLAFTFLNAYWLLSADVGIVASKDVVAAFGEALAPLIVTVIHIMYLGIMGWIGSILTLRGISILTHPKTTVTQPMTTPTQPVTNQIAQPEAKPKKDLKKEPEKEPEKESKTGVSMEVRSTQEAIEASQQPPPSQRPQPQTEQ